MSGGIKEGYLLAVVAHLISAYVLSDTACLACGNICIPYPVKDRCLTVVNVTHNNYNRASLYEILLLVLLVLDKALLNCNYNFLFDLSAKLISNKCRRIKVDHLVDRCHNT